MVLRKLMKFRPAWAFAGFWMLMMLRPALSRAQAEIEPDHYDFLNVEPLAASQNVAEVSPNSFRGKFTLPSDAAFVGLILSRGTYSVSIDSLAKGNFVTSIPDGKAFMVQTTPARLRIRSDDAQPSAFVVERIGRQHVLTAIRLKQPRITLDVHPKEEDICRPMRNSLPSRRRLARIGKPRSKDE